MRMRSWALPLLVAAGFLALALWADPASADKKATPAEIKGLIEKMGAGDFEEREKATQLLDAIGEPALEPLRKAQKSSDPEVRRRANDLVARIEKRTLGAAVLRPTRVHLVYKDTPLAEALMDLEKKTGYTVRLYDPKNALAGKKVTLDTGDTTFWDALDQFCAKAGLVEASPSNPALVPVPPPPGLGPVPAPVPLPAVAPAAPAVPIRRAAPAKPAPPKTVPTPKEEPEEKKEVKKPGKAKAVPAVAEAPAEAPAAADLLAAPAGGGAAAPALPAVGPAPAVPPGAAGPVPSVPAQILLTPGPAKKLPTDTSSSIRVRASDQALFGRGGAGQSIVVLEMTPEPRLQWQQTVAVRLKQAVDDQGQKLSEAVPEPAVAPGAVRVFRVRGGGAVLVGAAAGPMAAFIGGGLQYHPIHLKKGPKPAKSLKVLEGVITAKVLTKAEEVVTIDNLAKAVGKTIEGKRGATLKVVSLNEDRRGAFRARIEVTLPEGMVPDQSGAFPGGFLPPGGGIGVPVPLPAPVPPPARIRIRPAVKPRPPKAPAPPAKAGFAFAAEEKKPPPPPPAVPPLPAPPVAIGTPAIGVGGAPAPGSWAAGPGNTSGITLRDEKGKELPARILLVAAAAGKIQYQVWHQPQKGLGKPAKLVFKARRVVEVDIPFKLENVPLP